MKTTISLFSSLLLLILMIAGCSDDDNPVNPPATEPVEGTITAEMGADLANQVYIDLSEEAVTTVAVNTWELAFENDGPGIKTNTAKKVAVATPEEAEFEDVDSADGLVFRYDSEDGNLNTSAMGEWETDRPYVIDLGVDENGNALGYRKFVITSRDAAGTSLRFANLDGSDETVVTVERDTDRNFTYYSLISNSTVEVEPADWDLVMTPVSVRTGAPCGALGGGAMPGINCDIYRLTASAVINSYAGVAVVVDDPHANLEQNDDPESEKNTKGLESSNFESLTLTDYLQSSEVVTAADAIGRSWLQILQPHSAGEYKVYDFITYLLKDPDDRYFKIRFLAYRGGPNVENGNPTFEFAELENL